MFRAPPYPLFLDLSEQPVLVVGGGAVGFRKARGLVESAARVTVVSLTFDPHFDSLPDIQRIAAPYAQTHMTLHRWRLAFAATNIPAVNAQVQAHAQAAGILCCRTDEPEQSHFSSGASTRLDSAAHASDGDAHAANSGGIVLAVSTSGASPLLAARICREAAASVDPLLPMLAALLNAWRSEIKTHLPLWPGRRQLLLRLAGPEMESLLRQQGPQAAQRMFQQWYDEARAQAASHAAASQPKAS